MSKARLLVLIIHCFVIGLIAFMSVLGIGMIQHYLHIKQHPQPMWNEHGFPFTFYSETTFNDGALEGTSISGFLLDFLIYFLFLNLIFIGYKWILNRIKKGSR